MNHLTYLLSWTAAFSVMLVTANASAADQKDGAGFVSMFDGKSLQGWTVMPAKASKAWTVEKGMIVGNGDKGRSNLVLNNREIADYEMKFCYRFPFKGNCGVYIRAIND